MTGSRAARVDEDHAAGPAEEDVAAVLGIAPGSPVLLTHARKYTADGKLIEYAEPPPPLGTGTAAPTRSSETDTAAAEMTVSLTPRAYRFHQTITSMPVCLSHRPYVFP